MFRIFVFPHFSNWFLSHKQTGKLQDDLANQKRLLLEAQELVAEQETSLAKYVVFLESANTTIQSLRSREGELEERIQEQLAVSVSQKQAIQVWTKVIWPRL